MQSGTTGINTTRVYNPIKQAQDHDPHGRFVKRWLPHMRQVPDTWLFEPWLTPPDWQTDSGEPLNITPPIVDLAIATRESKQRLHARRQTTEVKAAKKAIIEKHASRKTMPSRKNALNAQASEQQLGFDF
jgi:deoxyribodipyrimidine photo-lyase